jgi:hypothetical protein
MTKTQAKKLAQQIFDLFDAQIVQATNGTNIPPRFIAGLVGNEAGKDKSGRIVRSATRFEPGVYSQLVALRNGKRKTYQGVSTNQIKDASDAALRALATSYEATQIMGYHCINSLHCTIADLRNPDKHFFYTVKLLQLNGFPKNANEERMDREMKQWNTGSETGKTYSSHYVEDARAVRAAYADIESDRSGRTVADAGTEDSTNINDIVTGGTDDTSSEDVSNDTLAKSMESSVIVTNANVNQPVNVVAAQPYQGVGFWAVIKRDMSAAFGGNLTLQAISTFVQQFTGLPEWLAPVIIKLAFVVLIGTGVYFVVRLVSYGMFRWTEHVRVKIEAQYKADPTKNNINWIDAKGNDIKALNGTEGQPDVAKGDKE